MNLKVTQADTELKTTVIEIQKDNKPVNAQNPVTPDELLELIESVPSVIDGGELALISGMPQWAVTGVAVAIKNRFSAIGLFDPKLDGFLVIHSTSRHYEIGQIVKLHELK